MESHDVKAYQFKTGSVIVSGIVPRRNVQETSHSQGDLLTDTETLLFLALTKIDKRWRTTREN
jgi:hypothetical protein